MSLHRYLVSPPLAIAIAPAKPHPPPRTEKKSDPQDKDKEKDKVQGQAKQEENKIQDPNPDPGPKADADPAKPQIDGAIKAAGIPLHIPNAGPTTPVSMIPEPPTPADGIVVDADAKPPTPDDPIFKPKDQPDETKLEAIDVTPDGKPKDNLVHKADEVKADKPEAVKPKNDPENKPKEPFIGPLPKPESDEVELIPEPLRLIGPPPKYPIRTILDLNPSHPWPPIESDPRGAYHHYAKGCYRGLIESVYIDVTKDGWMSGHWKDKSERDALAKLRGEDLRKARRELEWQGRLTEGRKVPKSAGDVLLCLWNLLVEAPNNELPTETFWASFNWDDPAAQVHTKQIPLEDMNANKSITIDGEEVEWTKAGVEQILATVGIQCVYKSDVPIGRRYTDRWPGAFGQDRAFIILGHNHFMLRLREWLEFKPEDTVGKFEVLVVSGHDRILGNMVKEQRMAERKKEEIEYYKRKKAQKEKAEAEAEAMAKGEKKSDDEVIPDGKKEGKGKGEKSDTSTKQVKDGREMVKPSEVKVDEKLEVKAEGQEKVEEGKLMVAIPIKTDGVKGEVGLDAKHDQIAMLAAPGEAAAAKAEAEAEAKAQADVANGGDGKDGDQVKKGEQKAEKNEDKKEEKQVRDPMRDAERIAKMMGNTGNLKMEDIQIALKVLEAASDKEDRKKDSKEDVGLLWTWGESCERWRWANYEAGVHEVGLGGWEERDWKVFADDRGVEEFEDDMGKAEGLEEDVHDWSC